MKILKESKLLDPKIEKAVKQAIENNYFENKSILKIDNFEFIIDMSYNIFRAGRIYLYVYENQEPLYELGFDVDIKLIPKNDISQQTAIPYIAALKQANR